MMDTVHGKINLGFSTLYLFQKNIILRSSLVVNLGVGYSYFGAQSSLQIGQLPGPFI